MMTIEVRFFLFSNYFVLYHNDIFNIISNLKLRVNNIEKI